MKPDLKTILGYFNNLSDSARYGILAGLVFLVILLDVFFLALPQIGSIADINDQITKMVNDTQQVIANKQRITQLKKSLQDERNLLNTLSVKVRPLQEVPAMLSAISSIAKEYDIRIDQLNPEYNLLTALNSDDDSKYFALPVMIRARSGYHNFGRFLNKVENQDMSFIIKDFIIQSDDKSPKVHSFSLTINMIVVDRSPAQSKNI